jgi:4-amino-4-deoxy-L-arabinose transferase-like glycosyltransferase
MPPASYISVSYWRVASLALIAISVFFVELGTARLWDRDEPRNSRASHEMLSRGDWIVPTFNGELRDHKPILLYWGQMLSYLTLGESEFAARLPSALCALMTIFAVAVLGSRLSGKPRGLSQEGFWAAGCMATCGLFVMAGRAATPDACLVAFSTMGIAALVIASLSPNAPYSSGRVSRARWVPAMFGYTMLGLAVLAKGPVGLVLPLIVVHAWWLICSRLQHVAVSLQGADKCEPHSSSPTWGAWLWQQCCVMWDTFNPLQCFRAIVALRTIPGVLLSLLAAAPWYIAVGLETNGAFLRGFFLEHNVGRALGSMEGHNGSILFYPVAFLVGTFPWSMWAIPVVLWCVKAARGNGNVVQRQMVVLSAVWIGVYVFAFSAASTKLPSYITPCYAGAALALGSFWRQFETAWSRPAWSLRRVAYALTVAVGVAIAVGIVWLSQHEAMPLLTRAAWAGAIVALLGGLGFWWESRQQLDRLPVSWLAAAGLFQVILFGFGTKSVDAYRSDLAVLEAVSQADRSAEHDDRAWLAIGGLEPSWVHYLGHEIVEVTQSESDPRAWQQVAEFLQQHPAGRLIVVGEATHEKLVGWQRAASAQGITVGDFHELAVGPRFLRPGNMRVFEQVLPESRQATRADEPAVIER